MNKDRLFINDQEIDLYPDTVIALTYQINDLAELRDRQANFSTQFQVPFTPSNIKALEWSQKVQSASRIPYRRNSANVIKNGIVVIPNGFAVVEKSDKDFNLIVYSGLKDFFELLGERKLADFAGLASYNHVWNLTNILASNANTTGYKYPIINYGDLTNTDRIVNVKNQRPAIFLYNLIDLIFSEANFQKVGTIFSDPNYLKVLLPLHKDMYYNEADMPVLENWFIGDPSDGTQSINPTVDAVSALSVNLNEVWTFNLTVSFTVSNWIDGTSQFIIYLLNNINFSNPVQDYVHPDTGGGGGNGTFSVTLTISGTALSDFLQFVEFDLVDCDVDVADGEYSGERIDGGNGRFKLHLLPHSLTDPPGGGLGTGTSTSPGFDLKLAYGVSEWDFNRMMPDITQRDFFKIPVNQFALFLSRDPFSDTIYAASMNDIIANKKFAIDWTDKLHSDRSTWQLEYRLSKYAQRNYLKYAQDSSDSDIASGTGDGSFIVDDETIQAETTLIQLPFAASATKSFLSGEYAPIIRRLVDGEFKGNAVQRMVIDDTRTVTTPISYYDGMGTSDETDNIPFCYFQWPTKAFGLGFDNSLIHDYYSGLVDVLSKLKKATVLLNLSSQDIANLDRIDSNTGLPYWFTPRYFHQFTSNFYINKVDRFTGNGLTKVELIKIEPSEICIPTFGDETLVDNRFPDPNSIWAPSGGLGSTWTFGLPGASYDDNLTGLFGTLSQFGIDVESPVNKFQMQFSIEGATTGEAWISAGGVDSSHQTSDGTYTTIIKVDTPITQFAVYVSADFDGRVTFASLKPQLTCP